MRLLIFPMLVVVLGSGCLSRVQPGSDTPAAGDDDADACEVQVECEARACQNATACAFTADGSAICDYQNQSDDTICDLPGSAAGTGDGACQSGICTAIDNSCEANSDCAPIACIEGQCSALGGFFDSCDVGDDADCAESLVCHEGQCLGDTATACDANDQCADTCRDQQCVPLGGAQDSCDSGDDADCVTGFVCEADVCLLANGQACAANSECAQTCIADICADRAADDSSCDFEDDEDCATSTCVIGTCGGTVHGQTFVVEVVGVRQPDGKDPTGITITELEFLDASGALLAASATETDAYDLVSGGVPGWWNSTAWHAANMFDGDITYTGNGTGGPSSALLLWDIPTPSPDPWARFAVFLDSDTTLSKIRVNIGSPEGRIPYEFRIFVAPSYSFTTDILARSNDNLTLLGEIYTDDTWLSNRWVEFDY